MIRRRELTDDERILWDLVARSTTPLRGRRAKEPGEESEKPAEEAKTQAPASPPAPAPMPAPATQRRQVQHLDRVTQKKIARGKLQLEARIDLHGMTQDSAHSLLLSFLHRAHGQGARYVLVITGKGSSPASDGILRRSVPGWFSTPRFREIVSGFEDAARGHGGDGALYVRLRRRDRGS